MKRRWRPSQGRQDLVTALALVVLAIVFAVSVLRTGDGDSAPLSAKAAGNVQLSAGWREITRPITGVIYPKQVLAAATYPISFHHGPQACTPRAALRQMPEKGVLLQIIEYPPTDSTGRAVRVPRLPPRPRRFSFADATYARFECAGPSYKFDYRQGDRALQAQVWMHRRSVDPTWKAGALQILNHFKP